MRTCNRINGPRLALLLPALVALLCSCTITRIVQVDNPTADCAASGAHLCHHQQVVTSIWKGKNELKFASGCPNGISRVKIVTRPEDVFLAYLTIGFVVRQHIDWDCAQRDGSSTIPR